MLLGTFRTQEGVSVSFDKRLGMVITLVTCSNHRISNPFLLGQRMVSKSNNQPTTRKVPHTYQLGDQAGNNAPGRKSMLIGTLGRTQKGVWVSFDKRPSIGDHTRYWNDNNTGTKYNDFNTNLVYEDKQPAIGDHTRYWNDNNTGTKYNDFNTNLVYEDKQPAIGDHTRYWNDNNTGTKYNDFNTNFVYEKGPELSLFYLKRTMLP